MIGERRVLGLITARGGSKGLPGKNILPAAGKPLIAWTIDAARASRAIDRLVLSTDDVAIANVARAHGCDVPFMRPPELATDTASSMDVVMHALDAIPGFDIVVLLQPTSPLRTAADIDDACNAFSTSGAPACVTVSLVEQSPYWMYQLGEGQTLQPILVAPVGISRRQDLPPIYALNGAVYVADVPWLRQSRAFVGPETVASVMPLERAIDIDTAADFAAFTALVQPPGA